MNINQPRWLSLLNREVVACTRCPRLVAYREQVARESQHHPAPTPTEAWQAAARSLVVRELLLQEARKLDIKAVPQRDDAGRLETEDEALVRGLIEREVTTPEPDEAACRRYYQQNLPAFRSPAIYEAAHILFAARRDDAESFVRAEETARGVLAELKRAPERFAEMARMHSACPSAAHGGNLGQLTRGQTTAEFEAALVALSVGAMSDDVLATRYGVHIIRLDRKIEERILPFELVADRIADYLRESVARRAVSSESRSVIRRRAGSGRGPR